MAKKNLKMQTISDILTELLKSKEKLQLVNHLVSHQFISLFSVSMLMHSSLLVFSDGHQINGSSMIGQRRNTLVVIPWLSCSWFSSVSSNSQLLVQILEL